MVDATLIDFVLVDMPSTSSTADAAGAERSRCLIGNRSLNVRSLWVGDGYNGLTLHGTFACHAG